MLYGIPFFNTPGWIPYDYGKGSNISCHDWSSADHAMLSNMDTGKDDDICPDPDIAVYTYLIDGDALIWYFQINLLVAVI